MSLDYDLRNIKDREEYFPGQDEYMHDDLHVLIWTTMAVGIGEITEANADEFYVRSLLVNQLTPLFTNNGTETYIVSREQVHHAVGLRTNAAPMTRSQFLKSIGNLMDIRIAAHKAEDANKAERCRADSQAGVPRMSESTAEKDHSLCDHENAGCNYDIDFSDPDYYADDQERDEAVRTLGRPLFPNEY